MNIAIGKECKTRSKTGFADQTIECKGFKELLDTIEARLLRLSEDFVRLCETLGQVANDRTRVCRDHHQLKVALNRF